MLLYALSGIILLLAIFYSVRSKKLLAQSVKLYTISKSFSRDYYVGSPSNPALTYVVLGDSTAQGTGVARVEDTYPYNFAEALAGQGKYIHVLNFAVFGAKAKDLYQQQLSKLSTISPDYITVTIGANDATHFTHLADYDKTVTSILEQLATFKTTTILFATTSDMAKTPALPPLFSQVIGYRARKQNALLRQAIAGQERKITLVDLYTDGKLDTRVNPNFYAPDLFHPAQAGYDRWAQLFTSAYKPSQRQ